MLDQRLSPLTENNASLQLTVEQSRRGQSNSHRRNHKLFKVSVEPRTSAVRGISHNFLLRTLEGNKDALSTATSDDVDEKRNNKYPCTQITKQSSLFIVHIQTIHVASNKDLVMIFYLMEPSNQVKHLFQSCVVLEHRDP